MASSRLVLRRVIVATMMVAAASVAVPTGATAAPSIAGDWWSIDREGVEQRMTIARTERVEQFLVYASSAKSAVCGGMAADARGMGTMPTESAVMAVDFRVACMVDRVAVCDFAATTAYSFDTERDVLTDEFAAVWRRTSATPVKG